jgi:hypothetical protein
LKLHAIWAEIYPWIIAAVGGFLGAALLLPSKLGDAVIQLRTNKLLEGFKAEQGRELERLKSEQNRGIEFLREQLNHIGDRGRRSNEMEFAAIEAVWKAFVKAWLSTNTCIGSMITIPRFSTMSDDDVKEFLSSSDLNDDERKMLMASNDREKEYTKIWKWRAVRDAGSDIYHARLTLREQRIFMPSILTKEFSDVIERMSGVEVQRRLSLQHPHIPEYEFGKATTGWMTDCVPEFDRMATLANQRLFREEREERAIQLGN